MQATTADKKENLCPICHQEQKSGSCQRCATLTPLASVWPPPPNGITFPSTEETKPVFSWRDSFLYGATVGLIAYITLTILLWMNGIEFITHALSSHSDPIYLVLIGIAVSPAIPASALAFLPSTWRKPFFYGLLVGSGIGLGLFCLVIAILQWFLTR